MSSHLQWMVIRNNSAFLYKGAHGQTFSTEANNLKGKNSFRYNGLVHDKTVGVQPSADNKGVELVTRKTSARNKPARNYNRVQFKSIRGQRRVLSKIRNTLSFKGYRKDLKTAALRRASALLNSQKPRAAKRQVAAPKKADK